MNQPMQKIWVTANTKRVAEMPAHRNNFHGRILNASELGRLMEISSAAARHRKPGANLAGV